MSLYTSSMFVLILCSCCTDCQVYSFFTSISSAVEQAIQQRCQIQHCLTGGFQVQCMPCSGAGIPAMMECVFVMMTLFRQHSSGS